MKLHRILPLAAAAVVFAACQAGDATTPTFSAEDAVRRNGVHMIGGGATSGPAEVSQDEGSQTSGSSSATTGGTTESSTSTDGTTTTQTDSTTTARGSQMGGSGG